MKLPVPGRRNVSSKNDETKKSSQSKSNSKNKSKSQSSEILTTLATNILIGAGKAALSTGAEIAYDKVAFGRWERPDYRIKPGVYTYDRVTNGMPRQEVNFPSGDVMLRGYFYQTNNPKGLVVVCHGIHSGADDYLPIICYMWKNGYDVFSFNYRGTYESQGDGTRGMSESLVDLDHALNYLENIPQYGKLPVMLIGHSWGGFAVSSVLSLHTSVKACAVISGFNSGYSMIQEKGEQYTNHPVAQAAGKVVHMFDNKIANAFADIALNSPAMSKPFLDSHQTKLFGDYVNYTGVMGINTSGIPVLVAHGNKDMVISINHQSIFAHKDEITNPNVTWYTGTGSQSGHDSIWHSNAANEYQAKVKKQLKALEKKAGRELTIDEKANFVSGINHEKFSEINYDLFNKIIKMFDNVAKKNKIIVK